MKNRAAMLAVMSALLVASSALAVVTPIYDIQYTTDPAGNSPLDGVLNVEIQGIVTAVIGDFYYLQDAAGPWNGIYVYDWFNGQDSVAVGDEVNVIGNVQEYYGLTELSFDPDDPNHTFTNLSSGNPLPAMTVLATGDLTTPDPFDHLAVEQWEGTLVRVENAECAGVCGTDIDNNYGEWAADDGSGAVAVGDAFYNYGFHPEYGEAFAFIQGPLDYSYDEFKIQPRGYEDFDRTDWVNAPDWDEDDDVDGNEFLMWQRGESPGFGDPDLEPGELPWWDINDWEDYFGDTAPPAIAAVATAVPEPAAGLLLMLAMVALRFRRHAEWF